MQGSLHQLNILIFLGRMAHTGNIKDTGEHNSMNSQPTHQEGVVQQQKLPDFFHKALQAILFVYVSVAALLIIFIIYQGFKYFRNVFSFEKSQIGWSTKIFLDSYRLLSEWKQCSTEVIRRNEIYEKLFCHNSSNDFKKNLVATQQRWRRIDCWRYQLIHLIYFVITTMHVL